MGVPIPYDKTFAPVYLGNKDTVAFGQAPIGQGTLQPVPAGSTDGTPIGTPPTGSYQGVRLYLPSGASVQYALAASQPGSAPTYTVTVTNAGNGSFVDEPLSGLQMFIIAISGSPLFRWI